MTLTDYMCQEERKVEDLLEDYIRKCGGRLIAATRNNTNDTSTRGTIITRKQKWEEKQPYGRFKQLTSDI